MKENWIMTRRESLGELLKLSGCATLAGLMTTPVYSILSAWAESDGERFLVEATGVSQDYSVRQLVERTFDAVGGIKRFVSRGDVVVIKPNISWAKPPHLAATTNPEVMQAVVELSLEAGAAKVRIADNTIQDYRRCFTLTGAEQVALSTGADLVIPHPSLMREMKLRGSRLDVAPVFTPVVEADKLINVPVAKRHALSTLTLGMKNWIGGIGGKRGRLHSEIHENIADLAQFFNPTVTLIDAIRIMSRNGPSGGSPSYVMRKESLILSNDQVAADTRGALLFGKEPEGIPFIRLAQERGLGTVDVRNLYEKKVTL